MRILYMGTPDFAVPCLEALVTSGQEVVGVVTQPDRPKGRGKQLTLSPVKLKAQQLQLPVYQPEKIKTPEFIAQLKDLQPELIVVVAFGQILSPEILAIPAFGCVNVHASLLPKYRGAAPIHWAVINGEQETGVTTMYMDQGLDTGDMIYKQLVTIQPTDTVGIVHDRLAAAGAELLVQTVQAISQGTAPRLPQNEAEATYAQLLHRHHERLDWEQGAEQIRNHIRGMNPWPGAFTNLGDKVLKVWQAEIVDQNAQAKTTQEHTVPAGTVIAIIPSRGLVVQTGQGQLVLTTIQLQGSRQMTGEEFLRGHSIPIGTRLGIEQ